MPNEAETGPAASLRAQASLRHHAKAAAAHFAAQAKVEIEEEALALIAEFMVAVTLTNFEPPSLFLPHAVMAAARVLLGHDELELARVDVRKEAKLRSSSEDDQDARERAEETVAQFVDAVGFGLGIWEVGDPALKVINNRRIFRGEMDWTTTMALVIEVWRKRRRVERQALEALHALNPPRPPKTQD